ncbi:sulfotransferase [Psychroserpens jangbogonensis]|uniref:sulfotransferase n=1 Tax=Psychroserpens jangbogonensis TaxID=1484460 RepID=UPI00053D0A2C|nr:sulfotransferase [Psychroserpens jangbogonensis]
MFKKIKAKIRGFKYAKADKVFCIGNNKTGTTSVAKIFEEVGLAVGRQEPFEFLVNDWYNNNYTEILNDVKYKGVAFQDIPFSLPNTYKVLDKHFPNSKFILTVRDSPEAWYKSLTSFHAKLFGNGNIPTKEDLQNADYIYKGWMWDVNRMLYNTPEDDIYNEAIVKQQYIDHNDDVIAYFKDKPGQLLVVNLKDKDTLTRILAFLGVKSDLKEIPWENKT